MRYKVMLADDEPIMRKALQSLINWNSIDCEVVFVAENGKEVLNSLEEMCPDILITDIEMPKETGLSLFFWIYSNLSDPDLNRSSIAEYLHMSPDYLSYVFHQKFNQTLSAYITSMRIDKAKELFERTNWGMDIIAEKTGFVCRYYDG